MIKIGKRRVSIIDLCALIAPIIVGMIISHFLSIRFGVDKLFYKVLIFLLIMIPAIALWYRQMKKHPDDPWRARIGK